MSDQNTPPATPNNLDALGLQTRKKRRWPWIAGAAVLVVAVGGSVVGFNIANQPKGFTSELEVATWSTDVAAQSLLAYISEDIAPDYGITIKPVTIDNLIEINRAVDTGEIAGNFFEHQPFLNDAIDANGFQLELASKVFTWDQASYSDTYDSWDEVPEGATIALRDDPAGQAIALLDLQESGQITLKPGKDTLEGLPQLGDIATNPKNYQFSAVGIGALARTLPDVDVIVVHISDVYSAGLTEDQIIDRPAAPKGSEGGLVVSTKTIDDPNIAKLVQAFDDPRIDEFLATTDDELLSATLGPIER